MAVRLTDLIAATFWVVWNAIKLGEYTHYWLKGGRSSGKSSFISLAIVLLLILDPDANAICFRKVGDTIRNSVYEQIKWAIEMLGLSDYFRYLVAPLEIVYIPTGQKIMFRGVDDPQKIKSLKLAKGYFKLAWFEELAEFAGMEEVNNVLLSVMRGGGNKPFCYFYSYNPPAQASNWVNAEANTPRADRLVVSSSYLDIPKEWLGEAFLREAEYQKKSNELLYRHIYLGEATGTGGAIFPNASAFKMSDEQISQFDNLRQGIDWGFVNDPFCFLKLHYDSTRRDVYIFEEIYGTGISNREAIAKVDAIADPYTPIYADSAEPKSIKEFKDAALYVKAADKGPGSVEYGIKFLQGLAHIYIDPDRCPNAWREFSLYELEKDRNGEWKREPPDKDNHCLAAGTQIITDKGLKAVEDIKRGDYVLTRAGYKKVLWGGISGRNMAVYEIKSTSGKRIKATAEHLVFTARGFVPVFELKAGDILLEAKTWQKSYTHTVAHGAGKKKRTTLPIPACIAERRFWQTNTQKGFFAVSRVQSVTLTGTEKQVYDLTVAEQHEFFANGILVHNCIDSARYALCKDTLTW